MLRFREDFIKLNSDTLLEIYTETKRKVRSHMAFPAHIVYLVGIFILQHSLIVVGLITGKSETGTDIDTHLSAPVEPVTYRRRKIYPRSFRKIGAQPYISERSELPKL